MKMQITTKQQDRMQRKLNIVSRTAADLYTTNQMIVKAYKTLTGERLFDEIDLELIEENMQFLDMDHEIKMLKAYNHRYKLILLDTETGELLEPATHQPIKTPSTPSIINTE